MQVTDDQQSALISFGSFCNKPEFSDVNFTFESDTTSAYHYENDGGSGDNKDKEGGIVIYGHKIILAARSEVFSSMFTSDPDGKFVENGNTCKIKDIQPDIFEVVMKYIYSATFDTGKMTVEIALDVLYAAKKYMINGLVNNCEYYLNGMMKPDNIHLFLNSLHLVSKDFTVKLDNLIQQKTAEILQNPSFMEVQEKGICYIGQQDTLGVTEIGLFVPLLVWAKEQCRRQNLVANGQNIRQVLGDALELVRYPTMTNKEFAENVVPQMILTAEEELWIFRAIANGGTPLTLPDDESITPGFVVKRREIYQEPSPNTCSKCRSTANYGRSGYCNNTTRYCRSYGSY